VSTTSSEPIQQRVSQVQPIADEQSVGDLVRDASTHMSTLVRSEIELAKLELVSSVKKAGISIALFVVAGAILIYALTFGFISYAEGLKSLGLDSSYAFAIVFGTLALVAVILAIIGRALIKRVHKPERTMTTVKDTADWIKHPTKAE
jgi:hypothetical protein